MFRFVIGPEGVHEESNKQITVLEKKYSIIFPRVLKDYYCKYDGEKIKLTSISVDGYECEIAKIVPIISDKMNFESIADGDRIDGFLPTDYYPLARDRGGNYYYWDARTGKVFLIFNDDYENPFEVAKSVEEFFYKMDNSAA